MALEFITTLVQQMVALGAPGLFLLMLFESSIAPIPSEVALVAAGAVGFTIWDITIFGTIGSVLGAIIGYAIGKYGGRPILEKYGKYFFVDHKKLKVYDEWFAQWGDYSALISRLVPLVPFKWFSIGAGLGKMKFWPYLIYTTIGTIPRTFILGYFGSILFDPQNVATMVGILIVFIALPIIFRKKLLGIKKKK